VEEFWNYNDVKEESEAEQERAEEEEARQAALIEAVLYLETEPLDAPALGRISGFSKEIVEKSLLTLSERYALPSSGVELSRVAGGVMPSVKKDLWESLREHYGHKNEAKLSRSAMETLAIIAYSQPITRSEIEAIRGVQADNMIRLLLERNLIRETGKKDIPGKPAQFGTTKDFLKVFGLESISDLPKLGETDSDKFEFSDEVPKNDAGAGD